MSVDSGKPFYLHIGLHKTASTYLQRRVFHRLKGVNYARHNRDRQKFLHLFLRSPVIWDDFAPEVFDAAFPDIASVSGERPFLYSNENISTPHCFLHEGYRLRGLRKDPYLLAHHLIRFRELLRARGFSELRIILFLRRQDQWMGSWYSQLSDRIPEASQADFEEKVDSLLSPGRRRYTDGAWLDYHYLVGALDWAMGNENVFACPYELLQSDPAAVWKLMRGFMGKKVRRFPRKPAEPRQMARRTGTNRWEIRPNRKSSERGEIALDEGLQARILGTFEDGNRRVNERMPVDLGEYGYF